MVSDLNIVREMALFQDLTTDELARVAALLRGSTFSAGTILLSAEQPGEAAYLIIKGTVKVHLEQADGREVLLAILGPGEIVGEMSLADSLGRSATATVLEESSCLWIDRITFQECMRSMPVIASNLVRILARRLRLANAQIAALATQDVYGRIARQLLAFAREYGVPAANGIQIPLRLTQNDFATLVGASRVRVNQVLGYYKQHGYISFDQNHYFTIHNQAALAQRCN